MNSVQPRYLPLPYEDSPESGRLILRDGTTANLRGARLDDKEAIRQFFTGLSEDSRRQLFFRRREPVDQMFEFICDNSNPLARYSLVVTRLVNKQTRIIAAGSYVAMDAETAEIAVAVADPYQGKGIGTILLERLALIAVANGFRRFWALTLAANKPMLDVFRESGFACHIKAGNGSVEVDLSVVPTETSVLQAAMRDRVSTAASLRPFFKPNAVAIVGASRRPNNIGHRILQALIAAGFRGPIYPVNPNASSIASLTVFPSVRNLPEIPDLAIVTLPRAGVLEAIDDCAARGVRAVIVITAGFAETGTEGTELQNRLLEKVRGYGMRMVGPNCLGLLNTDPAVSLNASFAPYFPPRGNVAFCSQSGALGLVIISLARERGLGLSSFVSIGNKADVSSNDLLQYWEEDKQTGVILLYLESFGNPRRFARIASRVSRRKPVVTVKAGRTGAGARAVGSHTAALAGSDIAVEALFHQTGVIRADTLDEMFDLAAALGTQPLPQGKRTAILTNAGGLGILCADTCEGNGLIVPELQASTKSRLRQFLPPTASVMNPVDMIASAGPDDFRRAVEILLAADEVDALIVLTIDVALVDMAALSTGITAGVAAARKRQGEDKPVLTCIMDGDKAGKPIGADGELLPNYAFPENAARVLGKLASYAEWQRQPEGMIPQFEDIQPRAARQICQKVISERGGGWLTAEEVRAVLTSMSLRLPAGGVGRTAEEAARLAQEIGFPVAVKLASRSIVHKTEVGGVRLNLRDGEAVHRAYGEIRDQLARDHRVDAMDGVLVQEMIPEAVELMVGVTQDPSFGPLIGFGLGGIHVEILKDVCFRVTPITDRDAREMVKSIRGYRLLEGYRGHPPADIEALNDLLLRVGRLVEEVPEMSEMDLNPVFALPPGQGCLVVDARISVKAL